MILMIDNYDSFTYNVYQYIGSLYPQIQVVRNDEITIDEIKNLQNLEALVISPGPGYPDSAGISKEAIKTFGKEIPVLGICLGHQCIGEAFGATVSYAKKICHGKQSLIEHDTDGIFEGINEPVKVSRYHSLAVIEDTLPDCLQVTARTQDGEIMAMKHREYPIVGLQFHPESIYTEHGKRMIENFVNNIGNGQKCLRNGD